jgi:hypothetical protein
MMEPAVNFKYAKPEVDVWAAASLYYMLTGAYTRDFPKGRGVWQVILQTSAGPIRQRNSSIPPRLAEVIDGTVIDKPQITFGTFVQESVRKRSVMIRLVPVWGHDRGRRATITSA